MVFMRSQVFWGVCVSAFVVLLCVDLACKVEGGIIKLANIGDNITLSCYRPVDDDNYKWWYRNETLLANWKGVFINDPRYTQGVVHNDNPDSNNIYISNIGMNDSSTFQCTDYYNDTLQSYDLHVIRCCNCITTLSHSNPDKVKVVCTLDYYWTEDALSRNITLNGNKFRRALFQENTFSFSIFVSKLNSFHTEFRLQIETDFMITCMLPTQRTPPSSHMTTLPTTTLKQTTENTTSTLSYTASKSVPDGGPTSTSTTKYHTPTNKHANPDNRTTTMPTTSFKQTTQNRPSTLPLTASTKLPVGSPTSISTTKHHTPKNKNGDSDRRTSTLPTTSLKQTTQNRPSILLYTVSKRLTVGRPTSPNTNSDKNKRDRNITMIVVILGSAFILILIVIIIVLRRKQLIDPEYRTSIKEVRESSLDQRRADHSENGEMVDDIVYDSADKIEDSSISRIEGPLDNALYTMPDKRAAISREPKSTSKVTDRSSNSDHIYGNSVIITQHKQNRDDVQQGDQYDDVKMPGSGGDAEEIPLYEMPDKGLMRNTLKATPKTGQTLTLPKDDVVSVDALYAKVDKTKKI